MSDSRVIAGTEICVPVEGLRGERIRKSTLPPLATVVAKRTYKEPFLSLRFLYSVVYWRADWTSNGAKLLLGKSQDIEIAVFDGELAAIVGPPRAVFACERGK